MLVAMLHRGRPVRNSDLTHSIMCVCVCGGGGGAICLIHAPARTWSMRKFLSLFFVFGGGGILAADHSGCAVCIAGVVP